HRLHGGEAMQTRDADVRDDLGLGAEQRGGELRLLGHPEIRGPRGDDEHGARRGRDVPLQRDAPSPRPFDDLDGRGGGGRANRLDVLGQAPRDEDRPLVARQEPLHDRAHLVRRLALGVDDLAGALAELAMMIDLGEPQVAEGQVPQLASRVAGRHLARGHAREQIGQTRLVRGRCEHDLDPTGIRPDAPGRSSRRHLPWWPCPPAPTSATSRSWPTWTTARRPWSTRCSGSPARSARTRTWPNACWTRPTWSARRASRSWRRTPPSGTAS